MKMSYLNFANLDLIKFILFQDSLTNVKLVKLLV